MGVIEALSSIIIALRIPLSSISGVLFIFTSILLFSPKNLLLKLAIFNFVTNHKETISLIWVATISVLSFYILCFILDIVNTFIERKNRIKLLNSLTDVQEQIILQAYKNGGQIRLPFDNAHANFLHNACILQPPSSSIVMSDDNFSVDYYLQPWVIKYIESCKDSK